MRSFKKRNCTWYPFQTPFLVAQVTYLPNLTPRAPTWSGKSKFRPFFSHSGFKSTNLPSQKPIQMPKIEAMKPMWAKKQDLLGSRTASKGHDSAVLRPSGFQAFWRKSQNRLCASPPATTSKHIWRGRGETNINAVFILRHILTIFTLCRHASLYILCLYHQSNSKWLLSTLNGCSIRQISIWLASQLTSVF